MSSLRLKPLDSRRIAVAEQLLTPFSPFSQAAAKKTIKKEADKQPAAKKTVAKKSFGESSPPSSLVAEP